MEESKEPIDYKIEKNKILYEVRNEFFTEEECDIPILLDVEDNKFSQFTEEQFDQTPFKVDDVEVLSSSLWVEETLHDHSNYEDFQDYRDKIDQENNYIITNEIYTKSIVTPEEAIDNLTELTNEKQNIQSTKENLNIDNLIIEGNNEKHIEASGYEIMSNHFNDNENCIKSISETDSKHNLDRKLSWADVGIQFDRTKDAEFATDFHFRKWSIDSIPKDLKSEEKPIDNESGDENLIIDGIDEKHVTLSEEISHAIIETQSKFKQTENSIESIHETISSDDNTPDRKSSWVNIAPHQDTNDYDEFSTDLNCSISNSRIIEDKSIGKTNNETLVIRNEKSEKQIELSGFEEIYDSDIESNDKIKQKEENNQTPGKTTTGLFGNSLDRKLPIEEIEPFKTSTNAETSTDAEASTNAEFTPHLHLRKWELDTIINSPPSVEETNSKESNNQDEEEINFSGYEEMSYPISLNEQEPKLNDEDIETYSTSENNNQNQKSPCDYVGHQCDTIKDAEFKTDFNFSNWPTDTILNEDEEYIDDELEISPVNKKEQRDIEMLMDNQNDELVHNFTADILLQSVLSETIYDRRYCHNLPLTPIMEETFEIPNNKNDNESPNFRSYEYYVKTEPNKIENASRHVSDVISHEYRKETVRRPSGFVDVERENLEIKSKEMSSVSESANPSNGYQISENLCIPKIKFRALIISLAFFVLINYKLHIRYPNEPSASDPRCLDISEDRIPSKKIDIDNSCTKDWNIYLRMFSKDSTVLFYDTKPKIHLKKTSLYLRNGWQNIYQAVDNFHPRVTPYGLGKAIDIQSSKVGHIYFKMENIKEENILVVGTAMDECGNIREQEVLLFCNIKPQQEYRSSIKVWFSWLVTIVVYVVIHYMD